MEASVGVDEDAMSAPRCGGVHKVEEVGEGVARQGADMALEWPSVEEKQIRIVIEDNNIITTG